MTRTELITYTRHILEDVKPTCITKVTEKASLISYDNTRDIDILISYATPVAVYSRSTATLYVFNYYSRTTVKHIYKSARKIGAMRITWLYRRSDGIIELALSQYADTYKYTKREYSIIEANDFIGFIENKLKW